MKDSIVIDGRAIGPGEPVYVIAEISANHGGRFDDARRLIYEAKACGADAVKLQTYTADTITLNSDKEPFLISGGTQWDGRTLYDLYSEASMPWEWQPKLKDLADEIGIDLFSSPFDNTAVEFLEKMDVPAYKVASFELVDIPLIRCIAQKGKPVIMSTGMATEAEISEAVGVVHEEGNRQLALMKCTSAYPASAEDMNLRMIVDMTSRFKVPVGLSDHTLGPMTAVAAVALGACIIEKHFTLCRDDGGPDSGFSLEPSEFKAMVTAIRGTESALGEVQYGPSLDESSVCKFRRSLFAVEDVEEGEEFTHKNVRSIRPAGGLHPRFMDAVVGRKALCRISRGTPLSMGMIDNVS